MNQITTKQEQDTLPVVTSDSAALMQVISRAASDPAYDIDKMERLFKMHQEIVARDAEREFNTAMAGVQAKSRRVAADLHNPQTHSNYASYAALDRALRPLYTEAGFALSFGTGDPAPDSVQVICHVTHSAGHTRKYQIQMPADGKGAKGGDVMTKTHATGSATQYGMRYLLKMIFNVAIGIDLDDDDGNKAGKKKPAQTETNPNISEETKNKVHDATLLAMEANDADALRKTWGEYGADEQVELWKMFNSAQRSAIKKLLGKEKNNA